MPTLHPKQTFSTRQDAIHAIQDFALQQGKRAIVDVKSSGGHHRHDVHFRVTLTKLEGERQGFRISSLCTDHYGCTGVAKVK
ncbi:hypothetical protein ACHHYP_20578 [Achlya hypogyna]|uniref:Uncharacterized protein n=1 Tax=Achlya hypogyna TaxID=1202772 RepID=A0A1V9ZHK5_ACHHY|nr:hypothetical protein ACHHYP_20578 [Achlya hypogyna]